jgi:Flp pilus assembly protein TadG
MFLRGLTRTEKNSPGVPTVTGFFPAMNQFAKQERGSVLVEFAVSAILLFMLIFGIMDFSRALYIQHFVANAAREATRYAMVRGSSWSSTCSTSNVFACKTNASDVSSFVKQMAPAGVDTASLSVSTTWPGSSSGGTSCSTAKGKNSAGCAVKVTVAYNFKFVLPLVLENGLKLSSTSEMTIAQ